MDILSDNVKHFLGLRNNDKTFDKSYANVRGGIRIYAYLCLQGGSKVTLKCAYVIHRRPIFDPVLTKFILYTYLCFSIKTFICIVGLKPPKVTVNL